MIQSGLQRVFALALAMAWVWVSLGGWEWEARAQAQPAEDPSHAALRALRTNILESITRGDIDAVLGHCHSNVVITWQNAEVCRGHAGVREFFERTGRQAWKGYRVPPTPDELTILHGDDAGVSFGETVSDYTLLGKSMVFTNRWTATLVKENERWLLASYHISVDVLRNPLIDLSKRSLVWLGAGGLVAGLALGVLASRGFRRNR